MVQKNEKQSNNLVRRFIGILTKCGKKSIAEKIVIQALEKAALTLKVTPSRVICLLLSRLGSLIELKTVRYRRNVFKIPMPVGTRRRNYLVLKSLLSVLNSSSSKQPMEKVLTREIVNAIQNANSRIRLNHTNNIKEIVKNRSNSHYRW